MVSLMYLFSFFALPCTRNTTQHHIIHFLLPQYNSCTPGQMVPTDKLQLLAISSINKLHLYLNNNIHS